ncbi:MAG TPA: dipicolinate synthase subunit B [Epulopiscium sp.]|nr:dipicolinate synthase subunit B [Candidatus Epulonipiscium sp.]
MNLKGLRLGVALCGSYCTHNVVFEQIEKLVGLGVEVFPIMSEKTYITDTRFGKAEDLIIKIETLTGRKVIHTIVDVEPMAPNSVIDMLLIAPCTGNTAAKLANAITDTSVTMAAKGMFRNHKKVIIALATNDGLGLNLKNIAALKNSRDVYFVPIGQDNYLKKPNSLVSHMELIPETIEKALNDEQLQPVLKSYK